MGAAVGVEGEWWRTVVEVGDHGGVAEEAVGGTSVKKDRSRRERWNMHEVLMVCRLFALFVAMLAILILVLVLAFVAVVVVVVVPIAARAWSGTLTVAVVFHARIE